MPRVYVEFSGLEQVGNNCQSIATKLDDIQSDFQHKIRQLDWDTRYESDINNTATRLSEKLKQYSSTLKAYKMFVDDAYQKYVNLDKYKNTDNENSALEKNHFGSSVSGDIADAMKWLSGDWVDDVFEKLPMWMREWIKKILSECTEKAVGDESFFVDAYKITQEALEEDPYKAAKTLMEVFCSKLTEGEMVSFLPEKFAFLNKELNNLKQEFILNAVFDTAKEYADYMEDPSLTNFLNMGWSSTVGAVLHTTGDAAWDCVKMLPGSGWYDEYGVENAEDAFNTIYTESVRAIWGDDVADGVSSYYSEAGGLFQGLVNGFTSLKNEIDNAIDEDGGFINMLCTGWQAIN